MDAPMALDPWVAHAMSKVLSYSTV